MNEAGLNESNSVDWTGFTQHVLQPAEGSSARLTLYERSISALPLPPVLWSAFQRACQEGASNHQLGDIIKGDPVLSAAILRTANTAGLVLVEINDIAHAISRLGHSMVRSVVARHAFASPCSNHSVYDPKLLWRHGMAVSALAEVVAAYIPACNADEASTLGLFHDVGRMGFNLITEFKQPAELDAAQGHLVYEYDQFACTHIDLGMLLADHWQLPEKIKQGIVYHHHPAYAEADAVPTEVRAEVLAVYIADMIAVQAGCAAGDSAVVLPHASFTALFPDSSLQEICNAKKVRRELAMIQAMEF